MSDPTRVVIFSAGPGAGGDGVAGELAAGLRRLGVQAERRVLADRGGPPWMSLTDVEVAGAAAGAAAVVSAGVLASRVLGRLRSRGTIAAPVVSYLADPAVHPLAVAEGIDVYLAGHAVTAAQARALGATDVRLVAPPVNAAFAAGADPSFAAGDVRLVVPPVDRAGEIRAGEIRAGEIRAGDIRARAGLPEGRLALIIPAGTTGSAGLAAAVQTGREVAATGVVTPVISCGGDELLRRRIARADAGFAVGAVDADLIRSCDVMVQNAGGQASLEALTAGVPVISYRCVPGPGRANAAALERAGLAPWIRVPDDLGPALGRILDLPVPRVDTAGPAAAEVIAALTGHRFPATPLPVRRIHPRRVRPLPAVALAHTGI
jgi:hypothetical protein